MNLFLAKLNLKRTNRHKICIVAAIDKHDQISFKIGDLKIETAGIESV